MSELKLNKGDIVSLKVTSIKRTTKAPFPKSDGAVYRQFHVTLEDKKGDTVIGEYLSTKDEQDELVPNVWQWIEVRYLSPRGTPEIYPAEEPRKATSNIAYREHVPMPGNTSHVDEPKDKGEPNCYSVHGKAITFAMGYAKDLLVAEIGANPRKITDDDIDRMTKWADAINDKICSRIQF